MYSVNIADGEETPLKIEADGEENTVLRERKCTREDADKNDLTPLAMNFRKEKVSLAMNALRTRAKPCEMPITMDMRLRKR